MSKIVAVPCTHEIPRSITSDDVVLSVKQIAMASMYNILGPRSTLVTFSLITPDKQRNERKRKILI
jgi:hypothetical protein